MPIVEPYQDGSSNEQERVAELIRARRGGALNNLDRMLLLSAPFAEGFNFLLPRVRGALTLSDRLRELVICAIAAATGAKYELYHHSPLFMAAGGTTGQLDALKTLTVAEISEEIFSPVECSVLAFTLECTQNVRVQKSVIDRVKASLADERQVFELSALVSTYNMVCRLIVSLDIEVEG